MVFLSRRHFNAAWHLQVWIHVVISFFWALVPNWHGVGILSLSEHSTFILISLTHNLSEVIILVHILHCSSAGYFRGRSDLLCNPCR